MNNLDKDYQLLLQDILDNGVEKKDRTNTGTISVFGRQIRHKMSDGFPLLTTKKMAFKTMVTELLWFLRGDTNIKYLVDNGCHIWDGDAYQGYLKRVGNGLQPATKERFIEMIKNGEESRVDANGWRIGELGPIYGKQWRNWGAGFGNKNTDQIQNLINDLKNNPDSRRLMVSAWNVGELDQMTLPPCHYGFQVYTRELDIEYRAMLSGEFNENTLRVDQFIEMYGSRLLEQKLDEYNIPTRAISLMFNMRSCDTFLGLPFNIASYGLLLEIIAKEVNMVPDELIGNLGDVHLYSNHVEQAKEQIGRKLTVEERMDWWFKNHKPNRDVCDHVDELSPYAKGVYFDSAGVPKSTREPFELPKLVINENNKMRVGGGIFTYVNTDFTIENYQSHPSIKAPLSN